VGEGIAPQALASVATAAVLVLCFALSRRRAGTRVSTSDEELIGQSVSAVSAAAQGRTLSAAPPSVPGADAALAAAPFDTAIAHAVTRDALVFALPPDRSGLFAVVFLVSWLAGWTVAIFLALLGIVYVVMGALGMTEFGAPLNLGTGAPAAVVVLFATGWLVGAIAGETAAMKMLFACLVTALGMQYVIASADELLHVTRLGGLRTTSVYAANGIANLRASDRIRNAAGANEGMQFEYGKRTIGITGMSKAEAGWMAAAITAYRLARASAGTMAAAT
jgi:hypothetical protein